MSLIIILLVIEPQKLAIYDADILEITSIRYSNKHTANYLMWYSYMPSERAFVMRAWTRKESTLPQLSRGRWVVYFPPLRGRYIIIRSLEIRYADYTHDPETIDRAKYGTRYRWFNP